jgi:predicted transposase/invertase (TIGR01784 family)
LGKSALPSARDLQAANLSRQNAPNLAWIVLRYKLAPKGSSLKIIESRQPLGYVLIPKEERARMLYQAHVKQERDDRARMRDAREEGFPEGKTEGKGETTIEIARKFLGMKLPLQPIVKATGLSEKQSRICVLKAGKGDVPPDNPFMLVQEKNRETKFNWIFE